MKAVYRVTTRKTAQGSVFVAVAEGLALPTGLLTAMVLSRELGPDGYGLFTLTGSLIAWLQWSTSSLLSRPTVKVISGTTDWQPLAGRILRIYLAFGLLTATLVFLGAGPISRLLDQPALAEYLRLYSVDVALFNLAHGYRNILVGAGRFEWRAAASGAKWIARLILVVVAVELGYGVRGAILASIGATAIELLIGSWRSGVNLFGDTALRVPGLWRIAFPLTLSAVSLRLFDRTDLFLLTYLGGSAAQAGMYGAAQNLTMPASVIAMSVSPLVLSTMNRQLRTGDAPAARRTARLFFRMMLAILPFIALGAACSPEIVRLIFGPDFPQTAPVFRWLAFGSFSMLWISLASAILTAEDKAHWAVWVAAPMVPCVILTLAVFVPIWGPVGAAAATALVASGGAIAASLMVRKAAGVRPSALSLARTAVITIGIYSLGSWWTVAGILDPLVKLAVLTGVAAIALYLSGEIVMSDLKRLATLWRKTAAASQNTAPAARIEAGPSGI